MSEDEEEVDYEHEARVERALARVKSILPDGSGCTSCDEAAVKMIEDEICAGVAGESICLIDAMKLLKQFKDKDITSEEFLKKLQELVDRHS